MKTKLLCSIFLASIFTATSALAQTSATTPPPQKNTRTNQRVQQQSKSRTQQPRAQRPAARTNPAVQPRRPAPMPAARPTARPQVAPTPAPMTPPPAPYTPPQPAPAVVESSSEPVSPSDTTSYWEAGMRLNLSQETVVATRTSILTYTANMLTQSQGSTFSFRYKRPTSSGKWIWTLGGEFGLGTIRFKGTDSNIPDQVVSPWYQISLNGGLLYRTTPVSDFGIALPVGYRLIKWPRDDATLTVSRETGAVYGLQVLFNTRISNISTMTVSFTHQLTFPSTVWAVGYDYAFR